MVKETLRKCREGLVASIFGGTALVAGLVSLAAGATVSAPIMFPTSPEYAEAIREAAPNLTGLYVTTAGIVVAAGYATKKIITDNILQRAQ